MEELNPEYSAISQALGEHYTQTFRKHGATASGVDWGRQADVEIRYAKMLEVIREEETEKPVRLLDVGCGYGGLLEFALQQGRQLQYTGIDISAELVEKGRSLFPQAQWMVGDVLALPKGVQFDYVVCNGILTQKLQTSHLKMNEYAHALIRQLFSLCERGAAFNVMSTHVNFQGPHLYHRSPAEMLAFCLHEVTRRTRLDHSYPLYEYTVYLYR